MTERGRGMKSTKSIRYHIFHPAVNSVNALDSIQELMLDRSGEIVEKFGFVWCDNPREADYLIASNWIYYEKEMFDEFMACMEDEKVIRIFDGTECCLPDLNIFDYGDTLYSGVIYGDRVIQKPIFLYYTYSVNPLKTVNEIKSTLEATDVLRRKDKMKFCNFIYHNSKAHPRRDEIYFDLSKYKHIDSLGVHLCNVTLEESGIKRRNDVDWYMGSVLAKRPYKFSIAAENATAPGYTTEKIITSLMAHTVPIYWGNPEVSNIINPNCYIDANKFMKKEDLIAEVKKVDNDDMLWCKMISESWRTEEQVKASDVHLQRYQEWWCNIFSQELVHAKRRGVGYHPGLYEKWFRGEDFDWRA